MAAEGLAGRIGQTAEACEALGVSRSTLYRRRRPVTSKPKRRPRPQRALDTTERERVLSALHCERFVDKAPAQVWATLLDEGIYHCSIRTMYRILSEHGEVRERRNQLRHPNYQKPELVAEAPNQVWSWDITKLRGPVKWTYFYLYVILDIFSRYVTGWMLARRESAELARRLISESCLKQNIEADQLTIHADRGSSMRSKSVALLLADLGITKTHSRPYVSNDNPYSESQFKTMKYCPEFPSRFGCLEDGRLFCGGFFDYYNNAHRHSGLGLMTPAAVHYGRADELNAARRQVLLEAHRAHPERFVHGTPQPPVLPRQVWINPPPEKTTPQEALGATFSGHPIPELPPDSSYPDAIASEPNRDRTALTPHIPEPGHQLTRNWGYYANASRGKRRRNSELESPHEQEGTDQEEQDVDGWRRRRKLTWAKLIQKVYEIDPLLCRFCGTEMKIISFITEYPVIKKILTHIDFESQQPEPLAHSPPLFQDTVYVPF